MFWYALFCDAVLCYGLLCHGVLCYALFCSVMLRSVVFRRGRGGGILGTIGNSQDNWGSGGRGMKGGVGRGVCS